jgi:hypothetical protein
MPARVEQIVVDNEPIRGPRRTGGFDVGALRFVAEEALVPVLAFAIEFGRSRNADQCVPRSRDPFGDRIGHRRRHEGDVRAVFGERIRKRQAAHRVASADQRTGIDADGHAQPSASFTSAMTLSCSSSLRSGYRGREIASE